MMTSPLTLNLLIVLMIVLATVLVVWPLRGSRGLALLLVLLLPLSSFGLYQWWGSAHAWEGHLAKLEQKAKVEKAMKAFKSPEAVINALKQRISQQPGSAKGWYLLGRLYQSQKDYHKASNAFARAQQLKPDDLQIKFQYAQALYLANDQNMTTKIEGTLKNILKKQPKQPDTLNFLAMDAYTHRQYADAIGYWRELLTVLPKGGADSTAIIEAIEKAHHAKTLEK